MSRISGGQENSPFSGAELRRRLATPRDVCDAKADDVRRRLPDRPRLTDREGEGRPLSGAELRRRLSTPQDRYALESEVLKQRLRDKVPARTLED